MKNILISNKKKIPLSAKEIRKVCTLSASVLGKTVRTLLISELNEPEMFELNEKTFAHECATDIITLDYAPGETELDGEIFICPDVAENNAKIFKTSLRGECVRLLAHGILHMCGFDDQTPAQKRTTRKKENEIIALFENQLSIGGDSIDTR